MVSFATGPDRLEWLVIRPLDLALLLYGIWCLIRGQWLEGAVLLMAAVCIGGSVGHSLSRYNEMRRWMFAHATGEEQPGVESWEETQRITKAVLPVSLILALVATILVWHAGAGFLGSVAVGFCGFWFCDLAFFFTASIRSPFQSLLFWLAGGGGSILLISKGARPLPALVAGGLTVLLGLFLSARFRASKA